MARVIYVPELGRSFSFKDGASDQEVSSFFESAFPAGTTAPAVAAPTEPGPDESGVLGRAAYGFATGFTDIPGGIAALMYPSEEAVKTSAGQFSEEARKYLQETFGIDPTKDPTAAQQAAQALGSVASFLVPGAGVAKGASLLGRGAAAVARAGTATAAAQGVALGASGRSQKIQQQLAEGMQISPEEQLAAQRLDGLIGASEALPIERFFGPLTTLLSKVPVSKMGAVEKIIESRLANMAKAGAAEGAQEVASGIANDLVEKGVYNPDVQIGQDLLSNAGTGAFAGSFVEGVIQLAAGRKMRPYKQLSEDLAKEQVTNSVAMRQGQIALGAEDLRNFNVEGDVEIVEEEIDGLPRFTIKTGAGNSVGQFLDPSEAEEAVDIYKQRTGAKVTVRKPEDLPSVYPVKIGGEEFNSTDEIIAARDGLVSKAEGLTSYMSRPDILKREAARQNASEALVKEAVDKEVGDLNTKISKLNEFISRAKPTPTEIEPEGVRAAVLRGAPVRPAPITAAQETIAPVEAIAAPEEVVAAQPEPVAVPEAVTAIEEEPIGAVTPEAPVEEARYIEEAPAVSGPTEIEQPTRKEMRPSATDEQLTALKIELFGEPKGYRDMTPEELSVYEAERDKRYPPMEVDLYSAGPVKEARPVRRTLAQAEAEGPIVRDYTPETKQRYQDIYTALKSRLSGRVPKDVDVKLEELISADKNVLIRGQARAEKTPNGIKSIVDLSTGVLRPDMTVEQAVKELAETLDHEIIHVLRDQGVLRPAEWNILSRAATSTKVPGKAYTYLDKAQAVYTPAGQPISPLYANPDAVVEEAVAEMYKDWVKNQNAKELSKTADGKNSRGLLNRITEFFRSIFRVLKSSRYEEIFKGIDTGEVGAREGVGRDIETRFAAGPVNISRSWATEGKPTPGASSVDANGDSPYRISQRRPTSKGNIGRSLRENLLVDVNAMKEEPGAFEHNIAIVNSYAGFKPKPGETPEQTLKRFKKVVVENLLWLHDTMDPNLRSRAKLWYDGARKITDGLSSKYNLPDTTVAAVLAGLSPQKDWFQNVSLAERLIDIVKTKDNVPFDEEMLAYAKSKDAIAAYGPLLDAMEGMTLADMRSNSFEEFFARKHNQILSGNFNANQVRDIVSGQATTAKAIFVRVWDEMNNPRSYNIITPEGDKGSISTTDKGKESNVAWGSFTEIGKGVNAVEDGTKESIDQLLGDKHKIRNFYNNIISPKSTDGSVTIDTHAVAAALMRALAGKSVEVHHNFGTSVKGMRFRTRNSSKTGVQGLYAIYADAYREAAKLRGILPREMQSITWEAVRGLYKAKFKAQKKNVNAIDDVWRLHSNGKITAAEARKRILEFADPGAKGINSPFWKDTPSTVIYGVGGPPLNTRGVGAVGLRQTAGRTGSGRTVGDAGSAVSASTKVRFSAAPVIGSDEFRRWFKNSKTVNPDGTPQRWLHGTPVSFKQFGKGRSGSIQGEDGPFFFSQNPKFTEDYSLRRNYAGGDRGDVEEGSRTIPVYLSVQKPFDYENPRDVAAVVAKLREMHDNGRYPIIEKSGKASSDVLKNRLETLGYDLEDGDWPTIEKENVQRAIRELGYDGFFIKENKQRNLAVYKPEQAKSIFNDFAPGTVESPRFSAAPLPPYVEAKNRTLFRPEPKVPFHKQMFDFFLGHPTVPKTIRTIHGDIDLSAKDRFLLSARVGAVDNTAYVEHLEKLLNERDTGNFQRRDADFSATAALAWNRRSSQLAASVIMMGKPEIKFARPGDIQSATIAAENDPDSLLNVFRIMLEPGPVDSVTGETKDKREVFRAYATAMRAIGLKAAGLPVPRELDDTYINTTITFTQQNYPEVVEAYRMYQRFNKNLLTAARDAGVITTASLANLTRKMDYYGFYREVYQEELTPNIPSKTAGEFDLREYKGSQYGNLIDDPMFVIVQNTQFWMSAISRNLAATKTFELAKNMGEARLIGTSEKPDPARGESSDVMFFRKDGVTKRFAVSDPLLVSALGSDDRADIGAAMKVLGYPTKIIRESVTRDPAFMITNLIRDTLSSWITSGEDFTPFIGTAKGFAKALKGTASYEALMGRGVVGSHDLAMQGPGELAATLRRRLNPPNVHSITSVKGATDVLGTLWDRLGVWSEASDAATRIAVYEAAKAQGMSEAEATFRAIQILDFSRKGGSVTLNLLTKLIPFLNARIQGLDVLYQAGMAGQRYLRGQSRGENDANLGKKFLVRGTILAAVSLALEMMNEDDEDYKDLPDYLKKSNLLIPLKGFGLDGQFLAIAKPFEAGLLFSTMPQQFYKTMAGDISTRENVGFFVESFASTLGVNPIPQILMPALEVIVNHDFYTGLPLISEGKARLAPELQYDSRTSTLARMLGDIPIKYNFTTGKFEGVSPIVIDQLIGGYAGPIGTMIAQGVGYGLEMADQGPERLPRDLTAHPIIRRFFVDAESRSPKTVAQAYELFRIVDEANRSFSRLRQTGDAEAAMRYLEENKDALSYKKYVFKLVDRLNKLSAYERQVERDKDMTQEEKADAVKKIREVRKNLTSKIGEINKALGR